jgi:3-hydroxybutyryl-CoA dehydrogenase
MGVGIVYVFAVAGATTYVVEPDEQRAAGVPGVLSGAAEDGVKRGKLSAEDAAAALERVHVVDSAGELPAGLHTLVESVPENLDLKRRILGELEAKEPTLLATNTSGLSIDALAEGLRRPEAFVGMHFFNPVWSSRMVEIVRGSATSDATLEAARSVVAWIDRESIVVRNVPGFATTRLDMSTALESMRMLEDGVASAEDIDRAAVLAYRHPIGPLRLSDVVGLDVRLDIARHLEKTYGERFAPPAILIEKVEKGEVGQKARRGFFDWS